MGILGITNRTENWKTARHFAPFFACESARARLAQHLTESKSTPASKVQIELFWKGVRDYIKQSEEVTSQDLADCYNHVFSDLRDAIDEFNGPQQSTNRRLGLPNGWNYRVCLEDDKVEKLFNNLRNTEIDIVLESPSHLFIGEAKGEMPLGRNGDLVLVHQLIRQYVMTKILLRLRAAEGSSKKKVIPFVVGDKGRLSSLKNTAQVRFMLKKQWLKEGNLLSWHQIEEFSQSAA